MTAHYVPGQGMVAWDFDRGCPVTWRDGQWVPDPGPAGTAASSTVVNLVGVIGEGRCTAAEVRAQLARAGRQPVILALDSEGGDVDQGLGIAEALAGHTPGVTARISRAWSIASVIAQACGRRVMKPGASMAIHLPSATFTRDATATSAELRRLTAALDRDTERVARLYATRAGGTAQVWRDRMAAEQRYSSYAAVSAGLADEVAP